MINAVPTADDEYISISHRSRLHSPRVIIMTAREALQPVPSLHRPVTVVGEPADLVYTAPGS